MLLNQRNVDIFFATAPAFVASLPPAPDRDKAPEDDVMLALNTSVVTLRFEFTRLRDSFSIEQTAIDLPRRDCAEANIALEDILDMLDNLVDGSICEKHRNLGNHFPRLESLKREILDRNPALDLDGLRKVPNDVLRYVCYAEPRGHVAARYRRLADGARQFNNTMNTVFSRHMGIAEAGSVEIFHRDRNSNADDLDLDKSDLEEIHAARKVSSTAKKIARILTRSICQKPHSAYIDLSGFPEAEIFTIMTITHSLAWIAKFKYASQHLASLGEGAGSKPIKIAILDTGLDTNDPYFSGAGIDRVDDWKGLWHDCLEESSTPVDDDKGRHGTALACLLLQLAPEATVYVLRVAKNSSGLGKAQEAIGTAILHAVTSWDVDIISMSFGFNSEVTPIKNAIVKAERLKGGEILFFAAANNDGLNEPEMFPALFESVISARGTECNGEFIQQYNPKSWSHKTGAQYGTLARDVPYNWPIAKPTKSGCSVSTPILAAIAALLISFVDNQKDWDAERHAIRTRRGIVSVFNFMAQDLDSFNSRLYVAPWQLYEQRRQPQHWRLSLETATTKSLTLWGAFLEKIRLGTTAQQERIKNGLFTMESLETIYLSEDPSPEEIKARCNDPLVREYMRLDSLLCSPVYMVTGIKVAKGFKLEGEKSSSTSVEFEGGGEVSQEASVGINVATTKKERIADEFESDGDIVFAYQLMKITPKGWRKEKRLKMSEYQHRQAFLVDEEEAEKKVEVEISEVAPEDLEELKGARVVDSVEGRVAFV
ncbi:hypothetical protein CEP53_012424 [Fusarium sp. AF-6]|nr:hypothetical protein CEP53_012424 [Fusarium sp. AF-6]